MEGDLYELVKYFEAEYKEKAKPLSSSHTRILESISTAIKGNYDLPS